MEWRWKREKKCFECSDFYKKGELKEEKKKCLRSDCMRGSNSSDVPLCLRVLEIRVAVPLPGMLFLPPYTLRCDLVSRPPRWWLFREEEDRNLVFPSRGGAVRGWGERVADGKGGWGFGVRVCMCVCRNLGTVLGLLGERWTPEWLRPLFAAREWARVEEESARER